MLRVLAVGRMGLEVARRRSDDVGTFRMLSLPAVVDDLKREGMKERRRWMMMGRERRTRGRRRSKKDEEQVGEGVKALLQGPESPITRTRPALACLTCQVAGELRGLPDIGPSASGLAGIQNVTIPNPTWSSEAYPWYE